MKKRSLVAAIAMLIVSALVLTTATYAWFASNSAASVSKIAATISNSDGSILLSADGGTTWDVALDQSDFTATTGSFATNLTPVSCTTGTSPSFIGGAISDDVFTGASATQGTDYTHFTVMVKTTADATVTFTPTFASAVTYGYGLVYVQNQPIKIYNTGSRSYTPIAYNANATSVTGNDANHNAIIDNDATENANSILAAEPVTGSASNSAFTLNMTEGVAQTIEVWFWAEGQDSTCTGGVSAAEISFTLSFAK